jgi:predicted XRE-type DNA-binding protein
MNGHAARRAQKPDYITREEKIRMAKPSVGAAQQPKTIQEWMKNELERDAELRREVEETLNRMRIEQDLATLRERRNLSQHQLAKLLGVSQPAVAKLEAGKAKNLELRTIVRYVTALGAKVRVLIVDDERTPKTHATRSSRRLAVIPARKVAGG